MPATKPIGPMVRMRVVRQISGLTLRQTCDRMSEHGVDLSEGGLSNIESGNKRASERMLIAWAHALGLDPLDVWHGPLRQPVEAGIPAKQNVA